jgi:hypothetical protein
LKTKKIIHGFFWAKEFNHLKTVTTFVEEETQQTQHLIDPWVAAGTTPPSNHIFAQPEWPNGPSVLRGSRSSISPNAQQ